MVQEFVRIADALNVNELDRGTDSRHIRFVPVLKNLLNTSLGAVAY